MADLPTNYLDDILAQSMNGKRKYRITRADGTFEEVTLEDVSEYEQVGSNFGAGDINKTNQAVNEKFDSGDVVDPMLTTEPGFAADAYQTKLQFDEQNKNLQWYIDKGILPDPNNAIIMLYDYGRINRFLVDNFVATGIGSYTFKQNTTSLYAKSSQASGTLIYTLKPVDLNGVKKVHFIITHDGATSIGLSTSQPSGWFALTNETGLKDSSPSNVVDLVLDVADYNDTYYLCHKTTSFVNVNIYQIYLEY